MNKMKPNLNISRRQALKIGAGAALIQTGVLACGGPMANNNIMADRAREMPARDALHAREFPFLIIRLHPRHHRDQAVLAEMLELFQIKPDICDEVWFCAELGFPDLQQHRE